LPSKPDVYVKVFDENKNLLKDTRHEVERTMLFNKTINIEVDMDNEENASCLTIDDLMEMVG